jgi:N utilization substance protein A
VRIPGALDGFSLTGDDANSIVMKARIKAGWIEAPVEDGFEATAENAEEGAEGEEPAEA